MWMAFYWLLVFMLFLIKATPRWLLNAVSWFCWFAVLQIGMLLASLPMDELKTLPDGLMAMEPSAYFLLALLASLIAMFFLYKRLFVACEVRKATFKGRHQD